MDGVYLIEPFLFCNSVLKMVIKSCCSKATSANVDLTLWLTHFHHKSSWTQFVQNHLHRRSQPRAETNERRDKCDVWKQPQAFCDPSVLASLMFPMI